MSRRTPRTIGKLGQLALERMAADAGLTANRSEHDERGWDYILEFPEVVSPKVAPDRQASPLKCFVQVKATDTDKKRVKVKLSNVARMVFNPLPTFFLIVALDGGDGCKRAYLVHVDEVLIRRVLKRLREVAVEGLGDTGLHKRTLSLAWSDEQRLKSPDGVTLVHEIRLAVGDDLGQYAVRKKHLIDGVGYEEIRNVFNLTISVPDDYRDSPEDLLLDFHLGIVPKLDIVSGRVTDVRFGIPGPHPEFEIDEGELSIGKVAPKRVGNLHFSTMDGSDRRHLRAELYVPQGIDPKLLKGRLKVLFKTRFVDFLVELQHGGGRVNLRIPDPADAMPLNDLRELAAFILFAARNSDAEGVVAMRLDFEGDPFGRLELAGPLPTDFLFWATMTEMAWRIVLHLDLPHDLPIAVMELADQQEVLRHVHAAVTGDPAVITPTFTAAVQLPLERPFCFLTCPSLRLGGRHAVVGTTCIGPGTLVRADSVEKDYEYQIRPHSFRITESVVTDAAHAPKIMNDLRVRLESQPDSDCYVIPTWRVGSDSETSADG